MEITECKIEKQDAKWYVLRTQKLGQTAKADSRDKLETVARKAGWKVVRKWS